MLDYLSILNYALMILSAVTLILASNRLLHMLQLEGYQARGYLKWLFKRGISTWISLAAISLIGMAITAIAFFAFFAQNPNLFSLISLAARFVTCVLLYSQYLSGRNKTFNITARVKRLYAAVFILSLALVFLPIFLRVSLMTYWEYLGNILLTFLGALLLPILVLLAHLILVPAENSIKQRYLNEAIDILEERKDLIRIGITGSYGKTSAKFILGTLLGEKYNVLVPPASYNTPMGITRVIREQLEDEHEALIAEMGARRVGEIGELCELVHPDIGVLTAIGPQHLETFGNIANVAKTKFELIESLPEDRGAAFFNADSEIVDSLFDSAVTAHKFRYGVDSQQELYVRAKDIQTGPDGVKFTLCHEGSERPVKTKLLGKHNVLNIAGAAAVALYLGLTIDEVAAGIEKLEPVEHRLQLIPGAVTVIDDAFNANPEGTKAALEVLAEFPGRKIVVTPGMVELGAEQELHNEEFGKRLARVANEVILVGEKQTNAIKAGLDAESFDPEHIHIVANLAAATETLSTMTQAGDVVLFENDLPANY